MKKLFFIIALIAFTVTFTTSCVGTKKDCRGVKHTRLKNGVWL